MRWQLARLVDAHPETATARTLTLELDSWPGALPGQHVDLRLTAEDGYSTQRSYSLAEVGDSGRVRLTIQRLADGEVSPFLADELAIGDEIELRGPVGGWFVWDPADTDPVLLVAGGSGVVPLMAMLRARRSSDSKAPFRLVYSVRQQADVYYAEELGEIAATGRDVETVIVYSRVAPPGIARSAQRVTAADLQAPGWEAGSGPRCYVCGSTGFVESVTQALVHLGHDPQRIRTERFGPSGG
ncbi:MAG: putative oxidoreductase [Frankiales bacterium]|nr:putative oxidoreductase [Frankiales bacterium]